MFKAALVNAAQGSAADIVAAHPATASHTPWAILLAPLNSSSLTPAPQGSWWWLPLPRPAESLTSSLADSNSWRASDSASANSACNSRGTRLRAAAGRTWQAAVLAGFGLQCSAKLTTVLTLVQAAKLTHQLLHRRPTAAYHDLTGQRWCCCSSRTAHWNWRCLMSSRPHLHCFCNLLQLLFLCICSVNQFCPLTASSPGDT